MEPGAFAALAARARALNVGTLVRANVGSGSRGYNTGRRRAGCRQRPAAGSGVLAAGTALTQSPHQPGYDVGNYNLGLGNAGDFNLGAATTSARPQPSWAIAGNANAVSGNIGHGVTCRVWQSGLKASSIGNIGLGNAANSTLAWPTWVWATSGVANTGTKCNPIGPTEINQTGIGGLNSGAGNIGLRFNSGTGNIGFFFKSGPDWGCSIPGSFQHRHR